MVRWSGHAKLFNNATFRKGPHRREVFRDGEANACRKQKVMTFTEILDEFGINYRTEGQHTRAGWVQLDCPYCNGPLYLGYHVQRGSLNCWKCGPLRLTNTLVELTGEPWQKCKDWIVTFERDWIKERKPRGKLQLPKLSGLLPIHRHYLKSRGFNPDELVRLWGVNGIGMDSKLSWRLFIPITYNEEVVSWTTRSLDQKSNVRYISASNAQESIPHKSLVFGGDYVRLSVIVVEGSFDVFRIGPGTVATMGTSFSTAQIEKLSRIPVRWICFDNEPQAQERARQLAAALEVFPGKTGIVRIDAKDPDSASPREVQSLRRLLK